MPTGRRGPAPPEPPRDRILEATLRRAVRDGSGALSLQGIADEAGVSKALLLYHFRDKDDILASLIVWVSERVVAREGRALEGSTPATVLEAMWEWLDHEIEQGELRVLVELAGERGARARQANLASAKQRHEAAERTMTRVFELQRLSPRVPIPMLAATELAVREGLTLSAAREPGRTVRAAFDMFWLALLRLAQ